VKTIHAPHSLYEVLDKGKAASVTAIVHTTDKRTGQVIFENQTTLVSRGSGGFGGKRVGNGQSAYGVKENGFGTLTAARSWSCIRRQHATEPKT
jgi:hypothetical protein